MPRWLCCRSLGEDRILLLGTCEVLEAHAGVGALSLLCRAEVRGACISSAQDLSWTPASSLCVACSVVLVGSSGHWLRDGRLGLLTLCILSTFTWMLLTTKCCPLDTLPALAFLSTLCDLHPSSLGPPGEMCFLIPGCSPACTREHLGSTGFSPLDCPYRTISSPGLGCISSPGSKCIHSSSPHGL